mgnify:CR=1 FL=1
MIRIIIYICIIFLFSCVDKHFLTYSIEGQKIKYDELKNNSNRISDFKLYFNKDEIDTEYTEIHFIATDYYYYGQFFFDKNFMSMLKSKTLHMGADALIYEKGRTDFPDYNKNFLYFTAIKYNN